MSILWMNGTNWVGMFSLLNKIKFNFQHLKACAPFKIPKSYVNWKKSWKCFLNETDVKICSISVPHVQTSPSYLLLHMIKKQFSTNTQKTFLTLFINLLILWRFMIGKVFSSPISNKCEKYSLGDLAKVNSISFNSRLKTS